MKVTNRTLLANWIALITLLVSGFILLIIYIYISGTSNVNSSSESFKNFYLDENKDEVKQEVLNRLDEILYEEQLIEEQAFSVIKHEIVHLALILQNSEISQIQDFEERQKQAVLEFEKMAEYDQEHLYFVIDSKGYLLRSGTDESIEGVNLYNAQDSNGIYYTQDALKAIDHPEGLFTTYSWPKEKDGMPTSKTSYCYYIPEYDIVVGTGVYHDDIQKELRDRVYSRLQSYYENKSNYIFIANYDGIGLVQANPDNVGKDLSGTKNHNGSLLHDEVLDLIKGEGQGFVTYTYYKKNSDQLSEKISFITAIEGWDVYMGMGFHTDDLQAVTDARSAAFKKQHDHQIYIISAVLLLITLLVLLLMRRGLNLQEVFIQQEEVIFTKLFKQTTEAIVIIGKGTVQYANETAQNYFSNNIGDYVYNNKLVLSKINDTIYEIPTTTGTSYYTEVSTDTIQYRGINCTIYFINNVTNQYLQANEYHKISLIDDLTLLPNRRALQYDFENNQPLLHETSLCVIGLIDLDHFKKVNDNYGHDVGDQVIRSLGKSFTHRLREGDKFYRYGGEEFIVVLQNISLEKASVILMTINKYFSELCHDTFGFNQTFSGGIVNTNYQEKDLHALISLADKKLYEAKELGRNRIEY